MLLLVTVVPIPGLGLAPAGWVACLWLCLVLLPLVSVVVYARRPRRRPPMAVPRPRLGRLQRRHCLRWPTCFPVALLAGAGRQEPLRRLPGTVVDISAGGLRVRVGESLQPRTRLQIDPEYRGPFPLAGLHCQVVASSREGEQHYLQLAFVRLPARLEARIVRRIYQHQLGRKPAVGEEELLRPRRRWPERRF